MFDHVVFTGTINLGAISGGLLTLLGLYIVYWRGKVNEQKTRRLIQEENQKTRECVHQLPGHPENRPRNAKTRKTDQGDQGDRPGRPAGGVNGKD